MGSVKRWLAAVNDSGVPLVFTGSQFTVVVPASDYDAKERECDKLAAKVERVRALFRYGTVGSQWVYCSEIDRALADEETSGAHSKPVVCDICHGCPDVSWTGPHGYGKCVERRKGERRASPMYGG